MSTSQIGELVTTARQAALWYEEHLAGQETLVYCEDGFDFLIQWRRKQFSHLTGLQYLRADRKTPVSAAAFYNMLVQRTRLDFRRITFSTVSIEYALRKNKVIMQALDMRNARTVYEISQGVFSLGVGDNTYCLGLVKRDDISSDARTVWVPKSMYEGDVTTMVPRLNVAATHMVQKTKTRPDLTLGHLTHHT